MNFDGPIVRQRLRFRSGTQSVPTTLWHKNKDNQTKIPWTLASGYTGNSRSPWPHYPMTAGVNHLTHMTLITLDPWIGFGSEAEMYDEEDAYNDMQFAKEMARPGSSRFDPRWPEAPWPAPVRIRRRERRYTCSRPCCGRQSTVSVYTDMEGVRKVNKEVRSCKHCGVAWSVTEGKVICESATEVCETSPEDAAWDALLPPVLTPF